MTTAIAVADRGPSRAPRVRPLAPWLCLAALSVAAPVVAAAQGFSHSIPIKLPQGAGAVQPQIALVYNPNGGNGFVGMGWQLTGLSSITRINHGRGINFDGLDTYAHSQLGVLVDQGQGTYRTKQESFTKFEAVGTCGDAPCSWIAHDRSGLTLYFGDTADSVISPNGSISTWGLTRVVDPFGNSYEVEYVQGWKCRIFGCDPFAMLLPKIVTYTKGPGLSTYRTVEFRYELRPDVEEGWYQGFYAKLDQRLTNIVVSSDGSLLRRYDLTYDPVESATGRSRLKTVQEFGSDGTTAFPAQTFTWSPGARTFDYRRKLTKGLAWYAGPDTWQQRMTFVGGDFDGDGMADIGRVAIRVPDSSYGLDMGVVSGASGSDMSSACVANQLDSKHLGDDWQRHAQVLTGDFDGDGRTETAFLWDDGGTISIALLRPGATSCSGVGGSLELWESRQGGWLRDGDGGNRGLFLTGDFNGDGKTDIAYVFEEDGQVAVDVHVSTGSSFELRSAGGGRWSKQGTWSGGNDWRKYFQVLAADFDGDGKTDLVQAWWTTDGTGVAGVFAPAFMNFDVYLSNGVNFGTRRDWGRSQGIWAGRGDWEQNSAFLLGDYNGDGRTDIAYVYNEGGSQRYDVHLSTGSSFYLPAPWEAGEAGWIGGTDWGKKATFLTGDFNGDGKTDVAYVFNWGGKITIDVHVSTGHSLRKEHWNPGGGTWMGGDDWQQNAVFMTGDFDGDGRTDIAYVFKEYYVNWAMASVDVYSTYQPTPDMMTSVDNGLGGHVDVTYAPAPQVSGAIVPGRAPDGSIAFAVPQHLTTEVATSDGRGGSYRVAYGYSDYRIQPGPIPDQRMYGFRQTSTTDLQTNLSTQTYYARGPGLEGRVTDAWSLSADGLPITHTVHAYDVVSPASGTELARERDTWLYAFEPDSYPYPTPSFAQSTHTDYDDFGNPTTKAQRANALSYGSEHILLTGDGLPPLVVEIDYDNDTSGWVLGRVKETRTKSEGTLLGWMKNVWEGRELRYKDQWLDTADRWLRSELHYDANGNVTTVTEPSTDDRLLRTTTTEYDPTFHTYPWKVTNALGHVAKRTYTPDGQIESITDVNEQTTSIEYDKLGRKSLETRPDGGSTSYGYLEYGNVSMQRNRVETKVDGARVLWKEDYFDGSSFTYMSQASADCGPYATIDFTKDAAGRPYQTSKPYCPGDEPALTKTTYDGAGRIWKIATPDGQEVTNQYFATYTEVIDQNKKVTRKYFDALKRVTSILEAAQLTTGDPADRTTSFGYDPLGRLTSVTLPDQTVTSITYDSLNRKSSVTDPRVGGVAVQLTYDALNRVIRRQAVGQPAVVFEYDDPAAAYGRGRLTKVTDASGTTRLGYTRMGQLAVSSKQIDGTTYLQAFGYDLAGRPVDVTYPDAPASLVHYAYTDGGNLDRVELDGAPIAAWSGYGATGKPGKVTYGNDVTTEYHYDVVEHLETLETTSGANTLQKLRYDWYTPPNTGGLNIGKIEDQRSDRHVNGVDTDETQTYVYDDLYRLHQATGAWGQKTYEYDAMGTPRRLDGLVARTLQAVGQQVTSGDGLSDVVYDLTGNVSHKVLDGTTWDYAWNGEGRLTSARKNGALTAEMVYDVDGERVKKVFHPASGPDVTTYYVNKTFERRVFADGSPEKQTVYVYANGHLLATVTREAQRLAAGPLSRSWRTSAAAAALYSSTSLDGAVRKVGHLLDAAALHPQTRSRVVLAAFAMFAAAIFVLTIGPALRMRRSARRHRPFGALTLAPRLRLGTACMLLVFGFTACGGHEALEESARVGRRSGRALTGDTTSGLPPGTHYYHRNHINSSSVITDGTGAEVARMVYVPFGELSQEHSTGGDVVTRKFTGQEYDEEIGLYYYGARYYDPALGRFMSADPFVPDVKDAQSYNRYSYCRNNPIVYVDPTGHLFDFIGDIFGAIGSAFSWVGSAISSAASWALARLGDATRFLARAGQYAWMIMKGMVARPESIFLIAVGLLISVANPAVGFAVWAEGMSIAIAAQSVAMAAGVRGPALSIISAAAGLAGGGFSPTNIIRVAGPLAVDLAVQAFGSAETQRTLGFMSALAVFALGMLATADDSRSEGAAVDGPTDPDPDYVGTKGSTKRVINPRPGGPKGPTITFTSGANNPVDSDLADAVEQAAINSGADFNVRCTTNGVHGANSRHYIGKAVDIDIVNGTPVNGTNSGALTLQGSFQSQPAVRENFGPYWNVKVLGPGNIVNMPQVASGHLTHIHISTQ